MTVDNLYVVNWEKAHHRPQKISAYSGNPFIEALPDILSDQQAYDLMKVLPPMNEKDRELDNHLRLHYIYLITAYFQPITKHMELQRNFSLAIRSGYLGRNPMHRSYLKHVDKELHEIQDNDPKYGKLKSTSPSFYINGFSGVGKTTGTLSVLELYTQVIQHDEYEGKPFDFVQIVWLRVECPHDGSLGGLCLEFFQAVDDLLGTDYRSIYKNDKVNDEMIIDIRRVVRLHGIGCLVIDEIQHLSVAKGQGVTTMLNFFVNLVNKAGVPIVLIGTPKILPILQNEFQQARRASGIGDVKWYPLDCNLDDPDDDWRILFEELWKYQYVTNPVDLTDAFLLALHRASAGITDFAVKAFILAQFRAILDGSETLTSELIESVASDSFSYANPLLNLLRNHEYEKIAQIPDFQLFDLKEHYEKLTSDLAKKSLKEIRQHERLQKGQAEKSRGAALQPDGTLQGNVKRRASGRKANLQKLGDLPKEAFPENDLRSLYMRAKKENKPLSKLLTQAGHIKDAGEFLPQVSQ